MFGNENKAVKPVSATCVISTCSAIAVSATCVISTGSAFATCTNWTNSGLASGVISPKRLVH